MRNMLCLCLLSLVTPGQCPGHPWPAVAIDRDRADRDGRSRRPAGFGEDRGPIPARRRRTGSCPGVLERRPILEDPVHADPAGAMGDGDRRRAAGRCRPVRRAAADRCRRRRRPQSPRSTRRHPEGQRRQALPHLRRRHALLLARRHLVVCGRSAIPRLARGPACVDSRGTAGGRGATGTRDSAGPEGRVGYTASAAGTRDSAGRSRCVGHPACTERHVGLDLGRSCDVRLRIGARIGNAVGTVSATCSTMEVCARVRVRSHRAAAPGSGCRVGQGPQLLVVQAAREQSSAKPACEGHTQHDRSDRTKISCHCQNSTLASRPLAFPASGATCTR